MTVHILRRYPHGELRDHPKLRTFREAVADKVRCGQLSPAEAISALVDTGGIEKDAACREVEHILRSMMR